MKVIFNQNQVQQPCKTLKKDHKPTAGREHFPNWNKWESDTIEMLKARKKSSKSLSIRNMNAEKGGRS